MENPAPAAFLALLAALLPAPAAAGEEPPPPPPLDASTRDFDQTHAVLRVTPRIAEGVVDGETTLSFTSLADPLRTLRLHSLDTEVLSIRDGKGRPLAFAAEGGILSIALAAPLPRGEGSSVTVAYRSRPLQGMFFHAPSEAHPNRPLQAYSQGQADDNRRWFPCYDAPDDRMTVELFATVPADLRTVSVGRLVASRPAGEGLREDHWRLEQRIPSYLVSLVAGRFETVTEEWKGIPLEYNGPPGRGAEMATGCDGTPAMMEFFTAYTGAPYPYPRYAQTAVWDFVYGGMENASATTMNMRLLHGKEARPVYSGDGLVAHELAHMWFGDLITCRTWEHLWLNEGFATYFTDLFFEHRDGAAEFALHRRFQNRRYMEGTPEPEGLGLVPSRRGDLPTELHGGKQYNRGAAILHQLRLEIGDDAFREGIRRYVREHADAAVTSEDFRRSVEAAAGRDLRWFFDQWVYGAGYPVLDVTWEHFPGSFEARVVVEQVQREGGGQPAAFRFSLPVRFSDRFLEDGLGAPPHEVGYAVDAVLPVTARKQEFRVNLRQAQSEDGSPRLHVDARFLMAGTGGGTFARVRVKQPAAAWAECLRSGDDVSARLDAVEALAEWPDAAAPALAAAAAADPSWAVRKESVAGLARLPGPGPLAALRAAAGDTDARVRVAAAEALGGRTREEAAETLRGLAAGDGNPYVRSAAARSLGKVHAAGAFDLLARLLAVDSHRETIRAGALDGLAALGDRRALDLARPLLGYDWPRGDHLGMREAALRLLLALEPDAPGTRSAVLALLEDPHHRMRAHACGVAGDYAVREAEAVLRRLAAKDPFESVREAAKAALERLAPGKR